MVEVRCQGANLLQLPTFSGAKSPWAEVSLDGRTLGQTTPHEGGDMQPRWNERFQVSNRGRQLEFRVAVAGLIPGQSCNCGEGTLDLQMALQPDQQTQTVTLMKSGRCTGYLQVTLRIDSAGAGGAPTAALAAALGPRPPQEALGAAMKARAGYPVPGPVPTPAGVGVAVGSGGKGGHPGQAAVGLPPGALVGVAAPGPANARSPHVGAHGMQEQVPDQRRPTRDFPPQAVAGVAPRGDQRRHTQEGANRGDQRRPTQEAAQPPGRSDPRGAAGVQLQAPPLEQQPMVQKERSSGANPREHAGQAVGRSDQRRNTGDQAQTTATRSDQRHGQVTSPQLEQQQQQPVYQKEKSTSSGASGGAATEQQQRLTFTSKGQQNVAALMQSKDKMREFAERPFKQPAMRGRTHMAFVEFKSAMHALLGELQIHSRDIPPDKQLQGIFSKFSKTQANGINQEEFEALLFRMLCFMLATDEVSVTATQAAVDEPQERDKRWREEFLKKNERKIGEVYEFGKKLGSGTFGSVYLVAHRTEMRGGSRRERVCKVISKAHADKMGTSHNMVREEFAVLKRLDHPHVLRIFEDFEDETNFYIVLEPCRGGDLQDAVRHPYTRDPTEWERWVARVMQHTLEAVAYCHALGVIHKDLKPENVMMSSAKGAPVEDVHIVVVDFGLAEMFTRPTDRGHQIAGTPPFMAPEVWAGNFSKGADVWSCGVMLFFMLSGQLPFMAQRLEDFPRKVAERPTWQLISGASYWAQEICAFMLCKEEHGRPSAEKLLGHQWFTSLNIGGKTGPGWGTLRNVTGGLMNVQGRTQFEKFVGRLVATQLDSGHQKQINEAFRHFDKDKDGKLNRDELISGLVHLGARPDEAAKAVEEIDIGKTGYISYTEFLAGVMDIHHKSPKERDDLLWLAWQQFNPDKDGKVAVVDIQTALAARGMTVAELPREFLSQLQKGATGTMDFQAFKSLFSQDGNACIMASIAPRRS